MWKTTIIFSVKKCYQFHSETPKNSTRVTMQYVCYFFFISLCHTRISIYITRLENNQSVAESYLRCVFCYCYDCWQIKNAINPLAVKSTDSLFLDVTSSEREANEMKKNENNEKQTTKSHFSLMVTGIVNAKRRNYFMAKEDFCARVPTFNRDYTNN